MPVMQYITSAENDFSRGIDARSAENQIQAGYVRDLLNGDITQTRAKKRVGYQGYAGNIPVRITNLEYIAATATALLTLDTGLGLDTTVSLESVRSTPLILSGKSSVFTSGQGPITDTNSSHYYPGFVVPTRKQFTAGTGTLLVPASEHGFPDSSIFTEVVESTSTTDRSYQSVIPDAVRISTSTFDINIDYTIPVTTDVFVYYANKPTVTGSSYVAILSHTGSGLETFTIPAGTHSLSNYNIVPELQLVSGGQAARVIPDELLVQTDGTVLVSIDAVTAGSYRLLLSATPIAQYASGTVPGSATNTVVISNPTTPWAFYGIYLEQTPGGTRELVYPDLITYDATANTISLSFTNDIPTARNFIVFYEYGNIRSNKLQISDPSITVDGSDSAPELTMWGLDHSVIYQTKTAREGWANHIDSYRAPGEQRLVVGLGGNLFAARTFSEVSSAYLLPQLFTDLTARVSAYQNLGPVFWNTGEAPGRTRGYITGDDQGTHWADITSVQYDSSNGWTNYTISVPSMQILDSSGSPTTIGSIISTDPVLGDYFSVTDMSYARHNGVFQIKQVQSGTDVINIWVAIPSNTADYDDLNTGGLGGVFTDRLTFTSTSPFIPKDRMISDAFGDTIESFVTGSLGTSVQINGMSDLIQIPGGLLFNASRTSSVIKLRDPAPSKAPSVLNLVQGDMISYTGLNRLLRIVSINPSADVSMDIDVSGTTATGRLIGSDTSRFSVGDTILIQNGQDHSGAQVISNILSGTEIQFETTGTFTVIGATLTGNTITVDEQITWQDSPADSYIIKVEERWIPIEAPDDSFNATQKTYVRYFDVDQYSDQSFLRSTTVQNNMYLTNGKDEVYKFDSVNNYRAGLLEWQPGLHLTQDTAGTSKIVTSLRSITYTGADSVALEGKLAIDQSQTNVFPVGTQVRLDGSLENYTVTAYTNDGTKYYVLVDRALDSGVTLTGTPAMKEIGVYRYYYRLNAVDINDNIIASAVTGSQDHVIEMTGNAAILHQISGMPVWDVYDYDRLEVQIYRTLINTAAPFYLVTTLPMNFNNTKGYLNFRDSFADSDIGQAGNLDIVNTALKGAELGTGWSQPLRSKYVTSIGNRLVTANLKDYPELDIQVVGDGTIVDSTFDNHSLLFRKDNTDTGTATDMINRVKYEWINGFSGDVSGFTIGTNQFSFTTSVDTGANAGDWIYLTYSTVATSGRALDYTGWWQIQECDSSSITVNLAGATAAVSYPDKYVVATVTTDVPVPMGVNGAMGMANGDSFAIFDSMRRMSMAINATMRQVDLSLTGYESFIPWMITRGGNDLAPAGKLLVRQPKSLNTTMEVVPTFDTYSMFINNIRRASGDQVQASTKLFPSRLLVSYENYPEIMDNPTAVLDTDSDSAIDINSADGQEITGIIPFFGDAAFTAAQQAAILVVFKTNSIYLVDINEKKAGRNPVQRIQTEGLGCTAPYSIASTKNGIIFANESGMYCLRTSQSIDYLGVTMERNWEEKVSLSNLAIAQGHHFGVGRQYKLSVPLAANVASNGYIQNSDVYVYDHTNEESGTMMPKTTPGAWSRYDNHPVTGWANLSSNAYFSSSTGRVFSIRNSGELTDYRDDSSPINFELIPRQNDFGNSGIRKVVDKIVIHYRVGANNTGTAVNYSVDLEEEYSPTTDFQIVSTKPLTGTADKVVKSVVSIRHSVGRRRCVYFGLQITNATIDENLEIAGLDYKVGGLSDRGITSAGSTK